jgi:hypothetical protein
LLYVLIYIAAFFVASVSAWLFVSIFNSSFGEQRLNNEIILPLDMIYKSIEEVEKYRSDNNVNI